MLTMLVLSVPTRSHSSSRRTRTGGQSLDAHSGVGGLAPNPRPSQPPSRRRRFTHPNASVVGTGEGQLFYTAAGQPRSTRSRDNAQNDDLQQAPSPDDPARDRGGALRAGRRGDTYEAIRVITRWNSRSRALQRWITHDSHKDVKTQHLVALWCRRPSACFESDDFDFTLGVPPLSRLTRSASAASGVAGGLSPAAARADRCVQPGPQRQPHAGPSGRRRRVPKPPRAAHASARLLQREPRHLDADARGERLPRRGVHVGPRELQRSRQVCSNKRMQIGWKATIARMCRGRRMG